MNKYDEVTQQQLAANRRTLSQLERAWGKTHSKLLPALARLADLHFVLEDYGNAELLYWRTLSISCKGYGDHHPMVASSLKHIAEALHAQGRFDEAERLYLWSFRAKKTTDVVCRLTSLYREVEAPVKAKWMEDKLENCLSATVATLQLPVRS